MKTINLNINNIDIEARDDETILSAARRHGIGIPTLCHDEHLKPYGACGICLVESSTSPRLLRACSTLATGGMAVQTDTERVRKAVKTALELLLSAHKGDCRPPCLLACPGQTDCQGYVNLIAKKQYKEANELIKEKLPLPSSIGRVCPHPCETACRRKFVEEPLNIAALKYFASDKFLDENEPLPVISAETGKSVAVIGGGPGGLTAAYFLRRKGYAVTVYDAMPKMGGMLRYGIPEYRLPKRILDKEIAFISRMGTVFKNSVRIGKDVTLDKLRAEYNSVVVAAGAWADSKLRCPGEDLEGVTGGIGFLLDVSIGNIKTLAGLTVAVIGGGNTAMDACRTAVRLGAGRVYNIYRRTRNEMPAEKIEIDEAEEEGVIFKNLANPIEIIGKNGKAEKIRLQIMELGASDASGRRAPVPVEGKEEIFSVDIIISAIGQKLNPKGFETLGMTKWGTISAAERTCQTNLDGVFAVGDATNKGADIAIAAIGEGRRAAEVIDDYLNGRPLSRPEPVLVKTEPVAADYAGRERKPRVKMRHTPPDRRKNNFKEINAGFSKAEASKEAARCLECGCTDYFECKLIKLANLYGVAPEKYSCETAGHKEDDKIPNIHKNPDKCILCGLCIRTCEETVGAGVLGFADRGFNTAVSTEFSPSLLPETCYFCGKCAVACPTGALIVKG